MIIIYFSLLIFSFIISSLPTTITCQQYTATLHIPYKQPTNISWQGNLIHNSIKHFRAYDKFITHNQRSDHPTKQQLTVVLGWMSQLYKHTLKNQNYASTLRTQEDSCIQNISTASTSLHDKLQQYQYLSEWAKHKKIIKKRTQALLKLDKNSHTLYSKKYTLSDNTYHYCALHDIGSKSMYQCTGTVLQQAMHREFINITDASAQLWHKKKISPTIEKTAPILANFIEAGVTFNHKNETNKAIAIADACWMLLDCIAAASEGIVEGITNTIRDIIHPINTIQNIIDSTSTCGYYIGKVALEVGQLGYVALVDHSDNFHQKWDNWTKNFSILKDAIAQQCYTLTARDVIKNTASFATQCYATTKVLHAIGLLFEHAHNYASKVIQKNPHSDTTKALSTPEGIIVCIADSAIEYMQSAQKFSAAIPSKVTNMTEFFKLPFGKLLLEYSQKTNYRHQKFPIYRVIQDIPGTNLKKGYFYYVDSLHRDHIEIFNNALRAVNVYNIDGTPNLIKTKIAIKQNRSIKKNME